MYQSITMPEFEQLVKQGGVSILDVREPNEFSGGHIKEAILMPLNSIPEQLDQLNKEETYYVICHSGMRSASASAFLAGEDYNVINVMGGMSAWKGETLSGM
ncbi:rhodanese-like domain-containing protein [Carnobacterium divergens]|uniref:rhodanese-like domain-containing protein n=1 Tax=Carnobacterium divergens TaxID=2748 RepID=UPI0039B022FD